MFFPFFLSFTSIFSVQYSPEYPSLSFSLTVSCLHFLLTVTQVQTLTEKSGCRLVFVCFFLLLCLMLFYPRAVAHYYPLPPPFMFSVQQLPIHFSALRFSRLLSDIIASSFAGIFIAVMSHHPAVTAPTTGRGGLCRILQI